jgi:signal transduction histidine kinase
VTLRGKLIALFAALAVVPLVGVGAIGYIRSLSGVRAQIEAQTRLIVGRSASDIKRRATTVESQLRLLAENAETERLLEAIATGGDSTAASGAASVFFRDAWSRISDRYESIELRDAREDVLIRLSQDAAESRGDGRFEGGLVFRVDAPNTNGVAGSVVARVRQDALLMPDVLDARFGDSGASAVVDRTTGRVLHSAGRFDNPPKQRAELVSERVIWRADSGTVHFQRGDTARVGSFVNISQPALTVLSTTALSEFAGPVERIRTLQLIWILVASVALFVIGVFLLRRATRSLEELTHAAEQVGRGDFAPALPQPGDDEVGRLSAAFGTMVARVRDMMQQIEQSRQLAAIGEFAAEVSHEIRNPLTSVKLNLQRIERLTASGQAPPEVSKPVQLALREISRLDRVVRGVLRLGQGRGHEQARTECEVSALIGRVGELVREQCAERAIELRIDHITDAVTRASGEDLQAAILNVVLNGMEAMPSGGTLRIWTTTSDVDAFVDIHVEDTGSGIPAAARERLFRPFVTTKPGGTGLGLALALRSVEAHGGRITLVRTDASGTEFCVRLPLVTAPVGV